MSCRWARGAAALIAIALVVVVVALLRSHGDAARAALIAPAPAPAVTARAPAGPAPSLDRAGVRGVGPAAGAVDGAPSLARIQHEYEAYKRASVYPHWSYRLTRDMDFLLAWNAAITDELPVDDGGLRVRFDADRGRVFAGEPYTSWIEAYRVVGGEKRPVAMRITRAVVVVTSGPAPGEAFPLAYRDDGAAGDARAGDLRYTNQFVPSEHAELSRATMARIDLYADIDGNPRVFHRDFVFAPRSVLEVTGVHDAIEHGSLAVTLDVDVLEPGVYTFYGNLMAADGDTPVATSKRSYPLEAGPRHAQLVFFGKVIRDVGVDGPYLVRDLHGLKRQQDDEMDVWWSHPAPHATRAYHATDFSPAEWDDPERTERLHNFEALIAAMERGDER